jgi:putative ABC transport system substrate-binding protein
LLLRLALTLCLALPGDAFAQGAKPRVAVIKSAGLTAYAQVVAGFSAEARVAVDEVSLEEGVEPDKVLKKVADSKPLLVLAIGPAAAVAARKQFSTVPIVFVMVPYFQKYELEGQNTTGIALTSDLSLELTGVKAVLPQLKRLGVLEDPRYSKKLIDDATQLATSRGLLLVPLELDAAGKVDKALSLAKGRVDGLVVVSDKTVGNAAVIERLLQFASDEKLPVVGLAPAQVKQGALFALAPAPLAIGQQAGRIVNRVLFEKVDPGTIAVASPDGVEVHVNLSAAAKLGLAETFARDVLSFAARSGLPVKATQ